MAEIVKETALNPRLFEGLRVAYSIGRFVGAARRSPVMANGQVPGIPRAYRTEYAKRLDLVRQRFGSAL